MQSQLKMSMLQAGKTMKLFWHYHIYSVPLSFTRKSNIFQLHGIQNGENPQIVFLLFWEQLEAKPDFRPMPDIFSCYILDCLFQIWTHPDARRICGAHIIQGEQNTVPSRCFRRRIWKLSSLWSCPCGHRGHDPPNASYNDGRAASTLISALVCLHVSTFKSSNKSETLLFQLIHRSFPPPRIVLLYFLLSLVTC